MDARPDPADPPRPVGRSRDPAVLLDAARGGDRMATGRLLSLVERGGEAGRAVGRMTFAASAGARQVIGITGAPGAGKSTLTNRLISAARSEGSVIGVLAIDPSSPFSGGAILGDRIRMQDHALDEGVFIRSMATRGHQGGLALAAPEAVRVLIAVGIPVVVVETVGVGQVEVDIAGAADTTVVVVTPGWGDAIQASKAGLLEIADVFVVNKADREGAPETRRDLEAMLDLNPAWSDGGRWRPPVVMATASSGQGIDDVWRAVGDHLDHLTNSGELERRRDQRLLDELTRVLVWRLERDARGRQDGKAFDAVRADLLARRVDPYDAVDRLVGPA